LKSLAFVDDSGVPTKRYFEFLDQTRSGAVLAEALRETYSDLFAINTKAQDLSLEEVKNKLRTLTQGQNSDNVLGLMPRRSRQ
jgi:chromosome segregation and condensation protein ScpB